MEQKPQPPTEKQMSYRAALIDKAIKYQCPGAASKVTVLLAKAALDTALLVTLPEPRTLAEASEQIDALQQQSVSTYARARKDWAEPVLRRLAAAIGNAGERLAVNDKERDCCSWTPERWAAYIKSLVV